MKNTFISTVSSIWAWVFAWGMWAWLMNLHKWTRTWTFHFTVFLIAICVWWFVWYIAQELTDSWAIAWITWAVAMKIFDITDEYSWTIIKGFLEKRFNIKLTKEKWKK